MTMTTGPISPIDDIFITNPYEDHQALSRSEAEVLWEYAKLAEYLKRITTRTQQLSETPDKVLLARMRVLEHKMGLVMTLFKASVWGVINEQNIQNDASQSYDDDSQDSII